MAKDKKNKKKKLSASKANMTEGANTITKEDDRKIIWLLENQPELADKFKEEMEEWFLVIPFTSVVSHAKAYN